MPVRVDIPIRIRVDPAALTERREVLEDALVAATGRALEHSRRVVLAEQGEALRLRFHLPEITWTGDGLGDVPVGVRGEINERLAALLSDLIREMGIAGQFTVESTPTWRLGQRFPILLAELARREEGTLVVAGGKPNWQEIPWEPELQWLDLNESQMRALLSNPPLLQESVEACLYYEGSISSPYIGIISTSGWTDIGYRFLSFTFWHCPNTICSFQDFLETLQDSGERRIYTIEPDPLLGPVLSNDVRVPTHIQLYYDGAEEVDESGRVCYRYRIRFGRAVYFQIFSGDQYLPQIGLHESAQLIPITAQGSIRSAEVRIRRREEERRTAEPRGGEEEEERRTAEPRGGRRAILVGEPREEEERRRTTLYPPSLRRSTVEAPECIPFLGEPSLEELGAAGDRLRRLIEEIAFQLQIPTCNYAGRFCIHAAEAVSARVEGVAGYYTAEAADPECRLRMNLPIVTLQEDVAGTIRVARGNTGNLGAYEFEPAPSPAIQFMRHLAGVVSSIARLARTIGRIYESSECRQKIQGCFANVPFSWGNRFWLEFDSKMKLAVASIFGKTCQVLLLQLLKASQSGIESRLSNIETYAKGFEILIVPELTNVEKLQELRERLDHYQTLASIHSSLSSPLTLGTLSMLSLGSQTASWLLTARDIAGVWLRAQRVSPEGGETESGIVVEGNTARIRDDSGRLWTREELERGLLIRRGLIESIDPLVKQLIELEEILDRFRNPTSSVRIELENLLEKMASNNREMRRKTRDSWLFAFRASKIYEDLPSRTIPGTNFNLQGIHRQAHEQIGEYFQGDPFYPAGVDLLFETELGLEGLEQFYETTIPLGLSVLCPPFIPLVFAYGLALSLEHYSEAREHERLYESLLDPELIMTRAEVEIELFMARLELALSIIPEAGEILGRGARAGFKLGARGIQTSARNLARGGIRGTARAIERRLTQEIIDHLNQCIVRLLIQEIATDQFMGLFFNRILEPVISHIERETRITGPVGGVEGIQQGLQRLQAEQSTAELRRRASQPSSHRRTGMEGRFRMNLPVVNPPPEGKSGTSPSSSEAKEEGHG